MFLLSADGAPRFTESPSGVEDDKEVRFVRVVSGGHWFQIIVGVSGFFLSSLISFSFHRAQFTPRERLRGARCYADRDGSLSPALQAASPLAGLLWSFAGGSPSAVLLRESVSRTENPLAGRRKTWAFELFPGRFGAVALSLAAAQRAACPTLSLI